MPSKETFQPVSPMTMQKALQLDTLLGHYLEDKTKQESWAAKYFQAHIPPEEEGGNLRYLNVDRNMIEGEAAVVRGLVKGLLFKEVPSGTEHIVNHQTGESYERRTFKTEVDEQGRQIVDTLREKHLAAWGVIFPGSVDTNKAA